MKRCTKCKKLKSKSEFSKNRKNKDGLAFWCKKCSREYKRRYYRKNRGTVKRYFRYEESHRTIDGVKQKRCPKCRKWKDEIQFSKDSKNKDGLGYDCKDCVRAHMRERLKKEGKGLKQYYRYEECHRVVDGVKQKRCRRCKRWKAESDFYKARRNKDGLSEWCKECANKATNKSRKKRRMANEIGYSSKKSNIRKRGLGYLKKVLGHMPSDPVAVSKFFKAKESWTRKPAWWFDLPIRKVKNNRQGVYYLLGKERKSGFVVLKVPNEFLMRNLRKFDTQYRDNIRLMYKGKVSSGLTRRQRQDFLAELVKAPKLQKPVDCPSGSICRLPGWRCRVRYFGLTEMGHLRSPTFRGLI